MRYLPLLYLFALSSCNYNRDYDAVKAELEKIKGVKILDIGGKPDDYRLKCIYAKIMTPKGGVLKFVYLEKASFYYADTIAIESIGKWKVLSQGCPGYPVMFEIQTGKGHSTIEERDFFTLGDKSSFREKAQFSIHNVQDVITHYDEILAMVEKFPLRPEFAHMTDAQHNEFYYQRCDTSHHRSDLSNPMFNQHLTYENPDCNCDR